jgi:NTE family protein
VDVISSVSGGSFTAAYYGLFREKLFADFRTKFLDRNIEGALKAKLLNPINLIRIASPWFGRIDLAAELYDQEVFAAATFARLEENGRPLVILNATNLGPGRRFDFTQEYFDAMGSRLDSYPVARAVAASSAFPFLLTPLSLKNYPLAPGYQDPWWYQGAEQPKDWFTRRYDAAKNLDFYKEKQNAYVHLMDGGLADNIGVRAILDAYAHGFIHQKMLDGDIKRLVLIVVNARTEAEDRLSRKASPPGIITVAGKTATTAMDNYSFESVAQLRGELYRRVQIQKDTDACNRRLEQYCPGAPKFIGSKKVDIYVVEVNFKAAEFIGEDPRYYLNLPTTFSLSKEQIEKLIAIGPRLLNASPQYKCLIKVLQAEAEGRPRPQDCPPGAGIMGN